MKIAILNMSSVGASVYNHIIANKEKIESEIEDSIAIKYGLVANVNSALEKKFEQTTLTTDIVRILDDQEIDCIIDAFSNVKFSYPAIKKAISNGVHIVSANKNLIALYGGELMRLARENKVDFYFEASIAGGVPIVRSVTKGLASDYIYDIKGILNGTTNYILTKMSKEQLDYKAACKEAKELGMMETHSSDDINGVDTARKTAILALLCYHVDVTLRDVSYKGIEEVTAKDIAIAHSLNYEIKLIGHSHYEGGELLLNVEPCFVSKDHPLEDVNYDMNSIYVKGNMIGDLMLYGASVGPNSSAVAILADLLQVASNMKYHCNGRDIVLPKNKKELTHGHHNNNYVFIGDDKMLQQVLNTIPVIKYTKDYVICRLSGSYAKKLASENKWKMYATIEVRDET